ncbi:transmembrane protein 17-like [Atheta coriaria]|uniref:transmembrane protein 17-like n=1 Tax=Dalotia coriaria TaxID=877792 RepID=UPI0031F3BEED
MDWKNKVTSLTDMVIPGITDTSNHKIIENEVMSNLPLQMSLYFNVIFFPIWLIVIALLLYDKYACYNSFTKFVIITIIVTIVIVETLRLYLGYEGNLQDKIPELAGFWMLSVLLQLPLQCFLLFNPHFRLNILDIVVQSTMCTLLTTQVISGYRGLTYTSKQQAIYYRIIKLRNSNQGVPGHQPAGEIKQD